MTARTSASSTSTMRAPSVPTYWSVACTSCPPGAETAPGTWPAAYSAGIAHVEEIERARRRRRASAPASPRSMRVMPKRVAPRARPRTWPRRGRRARRPARARALPLSQAKPGERPAHGAVAQRHHLVRHAGVDQRLRADDAARAAGAIDHDQRVGRGRDVVDAQHQLGARHVDGGRDRDALDIRRTAGCRAPPCRCRRASARSSSSAAMLGVPLACSTNSPNALLGTLTPENSSNPAAAQAATPPSSTARSV